MLINWQCIFYVFDILQLKHHNKMWCNGYKFCFKRLDEKMKTFDSWITTVFQVISVSFRGDRQRELSENWYYGYPHDILECDFESLKIVVFDVKWFRLWINERGPDRTIIEHANKFTMVDTSNLEPGSERYVFPSQHE